MPRTVGHPAARRRARVPDRLAVPRAEPRGAHAPSDRGRRRGDRDPRRRDRPHPRGVPELMAGWPTGSPHWPLARGRAARRRAAPGGRRRDRRPGSLAVAIAGVVARPIVDPHAVVARGAPLATLMPSPSPSPSPAVSFPPAPRPIAHPSDGSSNQCFDCHVAVNDRQQAIAEAWQESVHGKGGVTCADCHGGDPRSDRIGRRDGPRRSASSGRRPASRRSASAAAATPIPSGCGPTTCRPTSTRSTGPACTVSSSPAPATRGSRSASTATGRTTSRRPRIPPPTSIRPTCRSSAPAATPTPSGWSRTGSRPTSTRSTRRASTARRCS